MSSTWIVLRPHFDGSVRSPLTLPKMGFESPPGLLKTQSSIAGVKTPLLEVFFIPLERSWSANVQNGLAWVIWTCAAQVMVKRRAGGQTGNLTLDHSKSRIDSTPVRAGRVRHIVGNLSRIATRFLQTSSRSEVWARNYELPKSRESKPGQFQDSFGTPTWESWDKKPFGCGPRGVAQSILYGGRWWLPPSPGRGESSESKVARGLS
jgi:hypothetical protein